MTLGLNFYAKCVFYTHRHGKEASDMRVTATEFARNIAKFQHSVHKEPVEVTNHGRTAGFFLSPEEYAEYTSLKAKARKVLLVGNLSDEKVKELQDTSMDERHAHLNALLDD
jgi:PHD/YefM family antitoxin component YafN of YafNO toxin-antitoxin module